MTKTILCVGEVLWDSLPLGLFPGGAPFNVANHLQQLDMDVQFVSRVGEDELGREILRRMRHRGLTTEHMQIDSELPTGFVEVVSEDLDNPEYDIKTPAAWDHIELKPALIRAAKDARAIIFGSLAQRHEVTHKTIMELLISDAIGVFDVNLRPPYDDSDIVKTSLESADVIKLNDQELGRMIEWFELPMNFQDSVKAMAKKFACLSICVTQGRYGAMLYHEGEFFEHPGFKVDHVDAVGAGDAFLAGLITKLFFSDVAPDEALEFANLAGAYVVTQSGATPEFRIEALDALRENAERDRLE